MKTETYRFSVGKFECTAISDGAMTYAPPSFPPPARFLFCNAPGERLDKVLSEHNLNLQQWTEWRSSYTCLLINTGKYKVLVDTGAGGLSPSTGKLLPNLQKEAITPGDIDMIILTHAHPDHIGGNTDAEGKPAFPKARWVMWKNEWQFWTTEQVERQLAEHSRELLVSIARKNLLPLKNRLDLLDKETDIIPGISAIAAPGHTPGLMALSISSKDEHLLCISDVVIHPIHLAEPEWCASVDVIPNQVVTTRRKILKEATVEKSLVMAFHFPFPGLGHILRQGEGWQWQPIRTRN